jgi:hypothetical protein
MNRDEVIEFFESRQPGACMVFNDYERLFVRFDVHQYGAHQPAAGVG